MKAGSLAFFKKLSETPSPSGCEAEAQRMVMQEMKTCADDVTSDVHGNVIGIRHPKGSPRIMLAGHCDEVGYMVTHIDDNGYLLVGRIGGARLCCASGKHVTIHSRKGRVAGIMMRKSAAQMEEPEKAGKLLKVEEFWIDIGARDKADAGQSVAIGDPVTPDCGFAFLKNDAVVGRGFDDKVGAFVVTEVLRRLKSERVQAAVFCVATVQEEVGSRGVRACAYEIHPDIGIAIDVITATDSPEADKRAAGEVSLHKGPVLQKGCDINPVLGDLLIDTAERNKIPFQIGAAPGPTWTDASALQGIRGGSATAVVRIPNRYMHAPTEVVSLRDVDNAILLLVALIRRLRPGMDFRPLSAPNRTARPGRERSR